MGILQDEFERAVGEVRNDTALLAAVMRRAIANRAVTLTEEQFQFLFQHLAEGEESVDVPGMPRDQTISITGDEVERAAREVEAAWDADTQGAVSHAVEECSPRILRSLYDALPNALGEWHTAQREFEARLYGRWKTGLDRLDMLITMAHEAGESQVEDLCREPAEGDDPPEPVLMDVLTALHCRACRTARECVCLLKSGYADGANARWRSLHELAVTAHFILEHRETTPERYRDHAVVERLRAAENYQQHCKALGYDPYSDEEMAEARREADAAIARYGAPFRHDYGWAAGALGNPRPNFTDIEKGIAMAHWRPWFRLACRSVHAGSQGQRSALAVPQDTPGMLLAGASDVGLVDPGHLVAISLTMATVALLTARPNIDGLVMCNCMQTVCDDIGRELLRAHHLPAH